MYNLKKRSSQLQKDVCVCPCTAIFVRTNFCVFVRLYNNYVYLMHVNMYPCLCICCCCLLRCSEFRNTVVTHKYTVQPQTVLNCRTNYDKLQTLVAKETILPHPIIILSWLDI